MSVFDPKAYKETTHAQWQEAAKAWNDWGQVLNMTEVRQSPARIEEERQPGGVREDAGGILGTFSAPAMEPVVVMEDTVMSGHGLSFSAEVAAPQTLTGGEETSVPFAPISLSPEVAIEANPRRDDTAFIVARAENTSGEPLIAGDLSVYRDGAFLSEEYLETVPVGGELILPFGAVEHLQLFWRDLSRNEGETGLFTRGNTQVRVVEFGVTNVSDDPEDLRLIYAVPYSEQEDLELGLSLSVPPTEEDIDGRRGVHAWDMTVGPGETRTIRMESEMSWPEGYDLYWQP